MRKTLLISFLLISEDLVRQKLSYETGCPENLNFGIKLSTLESFVKSNGLKIYHSENENISKSEIGNLITKATVYVDCLMTKSRFEEVEAKNQKVLFKKIN